MAKDSVPHEGPLRRHERHSYLHVAQHWQHVDERSLCGKLNPTHLRMHDTKTDSSIQWNSRAHRKHRLVYVHPHAGPPLKRPWYRLWGFDFANISWWIAQLFTWGSVAWVLNGWFLFLPTSSDGLNFYMSGITAVIGGSLFWIGAYLSVVEAVNTDEKVITPHQLLHMHPHSDVEAHSGAQANGGQHANGDHAGQLPQQNGVAAFDHHSASSNGPALKGGGSSPQPQAPVDAKPRRKHFKLWGWRWRDVGYIAVFVQFVGATLFEVSVIVGAPNVLAPEASTNWWTWDAAYWAMQVVGAWGFVISAIIFMFECQESWWKPAPLSIGWHVGLWNLLGAAGFEVSAIGGLLAYPGEVGQRWVTYFSTFWGAWFFLIGSYFQVLEALNKHPTSVGQKSA